MKTIRALIVDDAALARERVREYLKDETDVEIAGEAASGAEAVRMIARAAPDLVFLDVQLPDFDGFEVARRLPDTMRPVVVYLTAHDDKALAAFEAGALDYLTKPFDRTRFARALNRARAQIGLKDGQARPAPAYHKRLAIKDKDRTDMVATSDIDYIDIAGHYLCVHVGKSVHLIRGALSELEEKLDPSQFARVHRSSIVRLDRVRSLVARRNGDSDLLLVDGSKLLMSRNYGEAVKKRLGMGDA